MGPDVPGPRQLETPIGQEDAASDNDRTPHHTSSPNVTSLGDLQGLRTADDWSRVRTLDILIGSAEDASTLLLAVSGVRIDRLVRVKITSSCHNFEPGPSTPVHAPKLQRASFAGIFLELDASDLTELEVTYDSSSLHRPSIEALSAILTRSTRLRRLELTDSLPSHLDRIEHPFKLPYLECIRLTESLGAPHPLCGSFLHTLSFPPSTEQHISTVTVEDALDVLAVSARRIWSEDAPSGLQLDVKSGYIGFHFYSDVRPHREKDDSPFDGAKTRAEISLGVKLQHLPPLMHALASSVDLSNVTTLSVADDTSIQPEDDGDNWRSVFEACSGVRLLHLADTRGSPQPSLLLALGAHSEAIAYAEARRSTATTDGPGASSDADEDQLSLSSNGSSAHSISDEDCVDNESGDSLQDSDSFDGASSSEASSANLVRSAVRTPALINLSVTDDEITPFPMLAERLRQLQQTIFLELNSPDSSQEDLFEEPMQSEGDVAVDVEEAEIPLSGGIEAARSPELTEESPQTPDEMINDGEEVSSSLEGHVLPKLNILWLASNVDSNRPVSAYTFPLEALVRALTSRAKSHAKTSASRSPRTLRVDVSVALREPGVSEPHLLEARVRFPNILWSDV